MAAPDLLPAGLLLKLERLGKILQRFTTVAVAYSGGVDSTVLLYSCCKHLGPENVVALQAISCLQAADTISSAKKIHRDHFDPGCRYRGIEVSPLSWPGFVENNSNRCYVCKKHIYIRLQQEMESDGCATLLDGTNVDDLKEYRPGRKAIEELAVKSPLLEAGLNKNDIRLYARHAGLANHALPSNSCLATRIPENRTIDRSTLNRVEMAEKFLEDLGFTGCRVKPENGFVRLQVTENDILRCVDTKTRNEIEDWFLRNEYGPVYLGLHGR